MLGLAQMSVETATHLTPATLAVPDGSSSGASHSLTTWEESDSPALCMELTLISTVYISTSSSWFTVGNKDGYDLDDVYAHSYLGGGFHWCVTVRAWTWVSGLRGYVSAIVVCSCVLVFIWYVFLYDYLQMLYIYHRHYS